jgi:hypothetical protein
MDTKGSKTKKTLGVLPVEGERSLISIVENPQEISSEMTLEKLSNDQRKVYDILIGRMSNKMPIEPAAVDGAVDISSPEYREYTEALQSHEDEKNRILNSMQVRIADLGANIPEGRYASLISVVENGFLMPTDIKFITGLIECHTDGEIDDELFTSNVKAYAIHCFVANAPITYPKNHKLMKSLLVGKNAKIDDWIAEYITEMETEYNEQKKMLDNESGKNESADITIIKEFETILKSKQVKDFKKGAKSYTLSTDIHIEESRKDSAHDDDDDEEVIDRPTHDDEDEDVYYEDDDDNELSDIEAAETQPTSNDDWVDFDEEASDEPTDEEVDDIVNRLVTTEPVINENVGENEKLFIKSINGREAKVKVKSLTVEEFASSNKVISMINKEKASMFGTVTIPMVHSGFNISFVAANSIQFKKMYGADPNRIRLSDHLARLKLMASSIIGTEPRVEPNSLLENISQADYPLMTFAHTAAACPKLQYPIECDGDHNGAKCGNSFLVESKTIDTLLNADELLGRWEKIQELPLNERIFKKTAELKFDGGLELTFEMPSMKNLRRCLQDVKNAIDSKKVSSDINGSISFLPNIKEARYGSIVATDAPSIYLMMEETIDVYEVEIVADVIKDLYEDIFEPKFGFTGTCPKCGKQHVKEVPSITDVVFYHCWIEERRWYRTQELKRKERETKDGKGGETTS